MNAETSPSDKGFFEAEDLEGFLPDRDLGMPGEFPFTRGIHPTMYRGPALDHAPVRGLRHRRASNARYRSFSTPRPDRTERCLRPPDPARTGLRPSPGAGEVGKVGVAIDSIQDMAVLFDGIPLDRSASR